MPNDSWTSKSITDAKLTSALPSAKNLAIISVLPKFVPEWAALAKFVRRQSLSNERADTASGRALTRFIPKHLSDEASWDMALL
jgi:hypothetical protein